MYILHKQTHTHGFKYEIPVTLSLEVRTIVPHYSEIPNSIMSTYCSLCYTIILESQFIATEYTDRTLAYHSENLITGPKRDFKKLKLTDTDVRGHILQKAQHTPKT